MPRLHPLRAERAVETFGSHGLGPTPGHGFGHGHNLGVSLRHDTGHYGFDGDVTGPRRCCGVCLGARTRSLPFPLPLAYSFFLSLLLPSRLSLSFTSFSGVSAWFVDPPYCCDDFVIDNICTASSEIRRWSFSSHSTLSANKHTHTDAHTPPTHPWSYAAYPIPPLNRIFASTTKPPPTARSHPGSSYKHLPLTSQRPHQPPLPD